MNKQIFAGLASKRATSGSSRKKSRKVDFPDPMFPSTATVKVFLRLKLSWSLVHAEECMKELCGVRGDRGRDFDGDVVAALVSRTEIIFNLTGKKEFHALAVGNERTKTFGRRKNKKIQKRYL
jgi:hypothetical protein